MPSGVIVQTVDGDLRVRGNVIADGYNFGSNTVGNTQFSSSDPLSVLKQDHQHIVTDSQNHGSAAVAQQKVIHVAHGDGTITEFKAGIVVAAIGAATVTLDLYKNGVTVVSGTLQINNTHTPYTKVTAGIAAPGSYVAGDVFEVNITVAAGGGTLPQGLFWEALLREKSGA